MRIGRLLTSLTTLLGAISLVGALVSCNTMNNGRTMDVTKGQVPTWSADDTAFYEQGSMSTEVVPEVVLKAFVAAYPDIFPTQDFSHLGAIPDPRFGWPIGFSRAKPAHLAGLPSVGINC